MTQPAQLGSRCGSSPEPQIPTGQNGQNRLMALIFPDGLTGCSTRKSDCGDSPDGVGRASDSSWSGSVIGSGILNPSVGGGQVSARRASKSRQVPFRDTENLPIPHFMFRWEMRGPNRPVISFWSDRQYRHSTHLLLNMDPYCWDDLAARASACGFIWGVWWGFGGTIPGRWRSSLP